MVKSDFVLQRRQKGIYSSFRCGIKVSSHPNIIDCFEFEALTCIAIRIRGRVHGLKDSGIRTKTEEVELV